MITSWKQPPSNSDKLLYCGDEHGIIQQKNGDLSQLKLESVNNNNFGFEKINVAKDNQIWKVETTSTQRYLSMIYLSHSQKIFAIYNTCSKLKGDNVLLEEADPTEFLKMDKKSFNGNWNTTPWGWNTICLCIMIA